MRKKAGNQTSTQEASEGTKRSLLLAILRYQRRRKSPFKTVTISTEKYGSTIR